jgi:hypothetical protein
MSIKSRFQFHHLSENLYDEPQLHRTRVQTRNTKASAHYLTWEKLLLDATKTGEGLDF